jgi:hypothetical protein
MKVKTLLSFIFVVMPNLAIANSVFGENELEKYIEFLEFKFSRGSEQLNSSDHPINFSLGLESAKWKGMYLAGFVAQERTSWSTYSFQRTEWHGQVGYRFDKESWFMGIQAGVYAGNERRSYSDSLSTLYDSHGLEGSLYGGFHIQDDWTLRFSVKPKGFVDGLLTAVEALAGYHIDSNWAAEGFYNVLIRDTTFTDYQTSIGFGVRYYL